MRYVVGIDPGAKGVAALLSEDRQHREFVWFKGFDEARIVNTVKYWNAVYKVAVCVEDVHSMPEDGTASSHKFGRNIGLLRGAILALDIPFIAVPPQTWQNGVALGGKRKDRKADSRDKAKKLWPEFKVGINKETADGILIAEFGRLLLLNNKIPGLE